MVNYVDNKLYKWFACPHRIVALEPLKRNRPFRILDVGCGNHSPSITKRYFPECEYHGVDNQRWNRDVHDDRSINHFFNMDLDIPASLNAIQDRAYHAIICSHVLEHLARPYDIALELSKKLAPNGIMYVEVPSRKSLKLPSARNGWCGVRGCLNFYDDETHTALVDLDVLADRLRSQGFTVNGPDPARLLRRIVLLPLYMAAVLVIKGFIPASILWDISGFSEKLVVTKDRDFPESSLEGVAG